MAAAAAAAAAVAASRAASWAATRKKVDMRAVERTAEACSDWMKSRRRCAAGDLLHVEVGEERVEPLSSRARSDAEQGGHHDRKKGAAELDAARQVLLVLLLGARGEERVCVGVFG